MMTAGTIDALNNNVVALREHLNKRFAVIVGAAIVGVAALIVGLLVLVAILVTAHHANHVANQAYVQSLANNKENLLYRRDFAQTRDCPVEYFKDLLNASRDKSDLTAIQPPCAPEDIGVLDAKIAEVDRQIAAARG